MPEMGSFNQCKSENDREAPWMFCHGAGEAAVHPGCGVYARAYGGNHGSFFFQGNGLRRREHRLFFNALPKECRSKDRAKGAHGQWSCQELFSPSVQGFQILGGGGLRYPIKKHEPGPPPEARLCLARGNGRGGAAMGMGDASAGGFRTGAPLARWAAGAGERRRLGFAQVGGDSFLFFACVWD